jgi:hypothetical protein
MMTRCYTFEEWVKICGEVFKAHATCFRECERELERTNPYLLPSEEIRICGERCDELAKKVGERYGLNEQQVYTCVYEVNFWRIDEK